jgi:cytoskeletal protein RodZ
MTPATARDIHDGRTRKGRFVDAATFGAFLENHRTGRNLSLHDVAAETKIATRHLAALERGDVRSWPGGLYRRAMVRAYASAIGLDPNVTVCEFADAFNEGPAQVEPDRNLESPVVHGLLSVRPRASVCVGLAVCAAIAALTWATTSSDAAGAIEMNRLGPPSTAGDHADVSSAQTTSGPAFSPSDAANVETPQRVATATTPQPAPSPEPPAGVEGAMRILSEPAGAQVTVNGIRWGQTPVTVRHLAPGEKRVRISKDGFTSAERRLQLTPDHSTQTVRVVLAVGQ